MATKKTAGKSDSGAVTCQECNAYSAHVLLFHLREAHGLTAVEYSEKHPGALVFSEVGGALLKKHIHGAEAASASSLAALAIPEREFDWVTVDEVFGTVGESYKIKRYKDEQAAWIPTGDDDGYIYDVDALLGLLYALHRERRNSVWIAGYSGVGKTEMVKNVHRRLNREMFRICFDSGVTTEQLIGGWRMIAGNMMFQYGLLVQAMMRGATLFLDELDLANPYVVAVLRPVLEEHPSLVILDNGGERVTAHPDFRVVVGANTFGAGDESGLYGTTHSLSLADRQRISLYIQMDYLSVEKETEMLCRALGDELDRDEAEMMVQVANKIREAHREGKLEESISPRQLVNWAEIYTASGNAIVAANMAFLLPLGQASQMAIKQLIEESGLIKRS